LGKGAPAANFISKDYIHPVFYLRLNIRTAWMFKCTMQTVIFEDLGQMPYRQAWDYQTELHRALIDKKLKNRELPDEHFTQEHRLLFVEHPPVFTLGRSGSADNLLISDEELRQHGIEYFPINRGGDITFHGPGQIVGYPILDLDCFFNDVHLYVRNIEEVVIRTLAEYGLEGVRVKEYTGVWIGNPGEQQRKICAIGVHISRWVTLHGWAFNINTPLDYFNYIVPCGIVDQSKSITSLSLELGREVDQNEVKIHLKRHFSAVFDCRIAETTYEERHSVSES
jgi:lipoyl(octanoyl) transferase